MVVGEEREKKKRRRESQSGWTGDTNTNTNSTKRLERCGVPVGGWGKLVTSSGWWPALAYPNSRIADPAMDESCSGFLTVSNTQGTAAVLACP